MSASLEQSRQQLLHTAAERADHAGGEAVEQFLRTYYRHVATEDLLARAPEDLLGAALAHRELAKDRPVGINSSPSVPASVPSSLTTPGPILSLSATRPSSVTSSAICAPGAGGVCTGVYA